MAYKLFLQPVREIVSQCRRDHQRIVVIEWRVWVLQHAMNINGVKC